MAVDLALNFNNVETIYDTKNGEVQIHFYSVSSDLLLWLLTDTSQMESGIFYLELCGLPRALSFSDLSSEMDLSTITALRSVYNTVDDIDLFPGLTSERPIKGLVVAKCFECSKCIIDSISLLNDLFCILIADSDSASDYGSFQYSVLSSMQS
uniref:Fuz_longin_1 domain-containing protein n=1 Tax=Heterorhabditis bacteriophora TaxID=37862 RepID=A0A1I7X2B6_HETBA